MIAHIRTQVMCKAERTVASLTNFTAAAFRGYVICNEVMHWCMRCAKKFNGNTTCRCVSSSAIIERMRWIAQCSRQVILQRCLKHFDTDYFALLAERACEHIQPNWKN